jgi:NIMA (never in mitosis gene a)-related kinase
LKYVHERKIVHRDLKPENIFKTKSGVIKLGDFGVSTVLAHTCGKASTDIGTPLYISPEILRGEKYDASTDVWSLGVTFYEMCALSRCFKTETYEELDEAIKKADYEKLSGDYSTEFKNIIYSMLNVDPKKRPTIKQILKNPLIVSKIRNTLVSTEFKYQFANGLWINDAYFNEYNKTYVEKEAP